MTGRISPVHDALFSFCIQLIHISPMLTLLRFLVKVALISLVLGFFASMSMGWLFAHPEVTTKSIKSHFHYFTRTAK